MDVTLKWDITYKCNLRCNHCINGMHLDNDLEECDIHDIKAIIDNLMQLGVRNIQLLGGEPFNRTDIVEIIQYFESNEIFYGINTNGLLLNRSDILKSISNAQFLSNLVISIDGPCATINDKIRGKNVFDRIVKNIKMLSCYKRNYVLRVNTVLCKSNYQYIDEMIKFVESIGADELSFLEYIPAEFKKDTETLSSCDTIFSAYKIAQSILNAKINVIPQFARPLMKDYIRFKYNMNFPETNHYCGAGTTYAYIDNNGIIYPCDRFADIISGRYLNDNYNLIRINALSIWKKELFSHPYCKMNSKNYTSIKPCYKCSYFKKMCYPCYLIYNDEVGICDYLMKEMEYSDDS